MQNFYKLLICVSVILFTAQNAEAQWTHQQKKQAFIQFKQGARQNFHVSEKVAEEFAGCVLRKFEQQFPNRNQITDEQYDSAFATFAKGCITEDFKSESIVRWDSPILMTLMNGQVEFKDIQAQKKILIISCIREKLSKKYPVGISRKVIETEKKIILHCIKTYQ